MDTCKACGRNPGRSDRSVLCSGSCGGLFHPGCVGLNSTNFKAWTANVGLLWFCDNCRVNFNPSIMDRESVIMKTMRDLLLRVDSMDLRIGQFGENLKTLCNLLSISTSMRRDSNISSRLQNFSSTGPALHDHSEFYNSIDRFNLDLSLRSNAANMTLTGAEGETNADLIGDESSDHINVSPPCRSRVTFPANNNVNSADPTTYAATVTNCATASTSKATNDTAAAPVINATMNTTSSSTATTPVATARSAATNSSVATTHSVATISSVAAKNPNAITNSSSSPHTVNNGINHQNVPNGLPADEQQNCRLRVVNRSYRRETSADNLKSFYVTPFHVEQNEEDVLEYLRETLNVGESTLRCVKLVPRNKDISELSFVSFKVSVSDDLIPFINDRFYWPEGVEIREFESKNEKRSIPLITT